MNILLINKEDSGGRTSYVETLYEHVDSESVVLMSNCSHSDYHIDMRTNNEVEFILRVLMLSLIEEIPNTDIIHTQRIILNAPLLFWSTSAKIITTCHGNITEEMATNNPSIVVFLYRIVERVAIRNTDMIIAVDRTTKHYLKRKGIRSSMIRTIPVGVNGDLFTSNGKGSREGAIFVGRIEKVKNIPLLINSISILDEVELTIVGSGAEEEKIMNMISSRGLDSRIDMVGQVAHETVAEYMNEHKCLVLTSDTEGSPNVVREALACELPIVSVPVGDVPRLIQETGAGVIVDRDPSLIAAGIREVLTDYDHYRTQAAESRSAVLADDMVSETLEHYESLNSGFELQQFEPASI